MSSNVMGRVRLAWALATMAILLGSGSVRADECRIGLEGNDLMQYSTRELVVPSHCTEVELTLHHGGKMPARIMGHDWVLARSSDVAAIANAGLAAGAAHGYLPAGDPRILASTGVIGGGESTTARFSTAPLQEGADYTFFCSSPGHSSAMKGRFVFGEATRLAASSHPSSTKRAEDERRDTVAPSETTAAR